MSSNPTDRGTGRTSDLLRAAPREAVFVWCNDRLEYPKQLARAVGRSDLMVVAPSWLQHGLIGRRGKCVVVDHAARLSEHQLAILREASL
jgi:hypothetical protein